MAAACAAFPCATSRCSTKLQRATKQAITTQPQPKLRQCAAASLWLQAPKPSQQRCNHRRPRLLLRASILPLATIAVQQAAAPTAALLWPALLSSTGVFILCCAAAVVLLSAIPLLWSLAKAANRMESMMQTLESELPDTAASMRLSSLELSDCLTELGALGGDLSGGLRASAQLVSAAEGGVRQGAALLTGAVVPALARRETQVRDVLEAALRARAALAPRLPEARAAMNAATKNARRARGALAAARVVVDFGRFVRIRLTEAALQQYASGQRVAVQAAAAPAAKRPRQPQQQQRQTGQAGLGCSAAEPSAA